MKRERQKSSLWFVLVVIGLWGLSGCEDSVRNPAQVRPPQIAPQPVLEVISPLPLDTRQGYLPELMTGVPDGVERLVASSQASIEAGELDYRAGNVEKARDEWARRSINYKLAGT